MPRLQIVVSAGAAEAADFKRCENTTNHSPVRRSQREVTVKSALYNQVASKDLRGFLGRLGRMNIINSRKVQ